MSKVFTICPGLENMGAVKTGGQGSVYKGKRLGELLTAIKILPTPIHFEDESDRNFRDFQNEVEKLKKVNQAPNPNVVKILSSGITDSGSFPFIEMEFIEGPGLDEMLQAPHPPVFTITGILKVAEQLASAINHCHSVNVKHGDIKSNNVKLNLSSGNYILLDFGMAIMSDEQRRTSMRYAGAIEFMAPEQNEGLMFFQTDIYSYGIVLYELLTGTVPFVLKDKSEISRNKVMLNHIESAVPDMLPLRLKNLPEVWSGETRETEMQVPPWLIELIRRCLEKNPFARFSDGMELYNHILNKRVEVIDVNIKALSKLVILRNENERLKSLVLAYQEKLRQIEISSYESTKHGIADGQEDLPGEPEIYFPERKKNLLIRASLPVLSCSVIIAAIFLFFNNPFVKSQGNKLIDGGIINGNMDSSTFSRQFKVKSGRAFFHNNADPKTKRNAYLLKSNRVLTALKDSNNFTYVEFINATNKKSKGWLRNEDIEIAGNNGIVNATTLSR